MNRPASAILGCALHGFLTDYLPCQLALSTHTIQSYRDSLKMLLQFISARGDISLVSVEQVSAEKVTAFLQDIEKSRHCEASTRNVRLSAIHSFFRYLGSQYPEHLAQAQRILSVPFKRTGTREIEHLEIAEIQALLAQIDRTQADGQRDFVLLSFLFNTGARVSEAVGLEACDLRLNSPTSVLLRGKGGKERVCPLWPETARALLDLLATNRIAPYEHRPVFLNQRQQPLTRFGARLILQKHVQRTAEKIPSLKGKRIHPHSLRHSAAIHLLRAGVDLSTIAHWLGHASINTTNKYISLDLESKRQALDKAKPILPANGPSYPWRKNQTLIEWLESL